MVEPFDLIVIGGGINGAAIARDAAMRGMSVALFEKGDFGSGASSKTSKLVHGGIRYPERFHLGLVKESLRERGLLLKNAPHLVHPLQFAMPVYAKDSRPLWQIHLGLYLYDFLSGRKNTLPRHQKLGRDDFAKLFPGMTREGLRGACTFYDAQMFDSRIVIENVLSAEEHGAVVRNYVAVEGLIRNGGKMVGVTCKDVFTGSVAVVYGRVVVNATGAWTEDVAAMEPAVTHCRTSPTKGIHIIIPKISAEKALLLHAPQDKRVFFVLPWGQHSLVGTTDTFYHGDPDNVSVEGEDCDYLLEALNIYFPDAKLDRRSIISSFAGLRPLVDTDSKDAASDIGREHVIHTSSGGMVSVLGGRYTTHRHIAEEVVDGVIKTLGAHHFLPCKTHEEQLPGAQGSSLDDVQTLLKKEGLDNFTVERMIKAYGTKSLNVLHLIQQDPKQGGAVWKGSSYLLAELTYSVCNEHVKTVDDWLYRRSWMGYTEGSHDEICAGISQVIQKELDAKG